MSASSKELVEAKEKEFMSLLLKAIDEENCSKRALLLWDAKHEVCIGATVSGKVAFEIVGIGGKIMEVGEAQKLSLILDAAITSAMKTKNDDDQRPYHNAQYA